MLSKETIQTLIIIKVLKVRGETQPHVLNHISGQIRAFISVIAERPAPWNDFLPDLLEMADIPYEEDSSGDIGFSTSFLQSLGFVVQGQEIQHPVYGEEW